MCHLEDFQSVNELPFPFADAGRLAPAKSSMYDRQRIATLTIHEVQPMTQLRPLFAPCMLCAAKQSSDNACTAPSHHTELLLLLLLLTGLLGVALRSYTSGAGLMSSGMEATKDAMCRSPCRHLTRSVESVKPRRQYCCTEKQAVLKALLQVAMHDAVAPHLKMEGVERAEEQ
jgi:hypothetical protein